MVRDVVTRFVTLGREPQNPLYDPHVNFDGTIVVDRAEVLIDNPEEYLVRVFGYSRESKKWEPIVVHRRKQSSL
jgi:hypothetical protein